MAYHIDYKKTDDILFERINERTRLFAIKINKRITAQELIDQV